MKFRRSTHKTVAKDLIAFAKIVKDERYANQVEIAVWLNDKLDEWLADDAFGTEGQCDPRGDHRE